MGMAIYSLSVKDVVIIDEVGNLLVIHSSVTKWNATRYLTSFYLEVHQQYGWQSDQSLVDYSMAISSSIDDSVAISRPSK